MSVPAGLRRRALRIAAATAVALAAPVPAAHAVDLVQYDAHVTAETGDAPRIRDADGRTVLLRGINVVGLGDYFQNDPAQPPRFDLTEQDFADIAAFGFDHVRLIVHWSLLEPAPGEHSASHLADIREALGWARQHDLGVVLDMHQDAWGKHVDTKPDEVCAPGFDPAVGWDGAPLWATLTDDLPTCKAVLRELSPAVTQAWTSFFADRDPGDGVGIQTRLVQTWGWLAGEVGADPTVLGYDLLNEPNSGFLFGVGQTAQLATFYGAAIEAIRAGEATAGRPVPGVVFFEPGVEWSAASITATVPPSFTDDGAIVFAPHIYAGSISPASIPQGFDNAQMVARLYGSDVWSGEWGYFGDPAVEEPNLREFAAEEDTRLVHSAFWDWRQACGDPHNFYTDRSVQTPVSPSLVRYACPGDVELGTPEPFATVLSRSRPRAVPGRLTSFTSDVDSGALHVEGTADTPGDLDLWVPDRGTGEPQVTGTNLDLGTLAVRRVPATDRAVGGWRVAVGTAGAGAYVADVALGLAAPAPTPTPTPTTAPVTTPPVAPAPTGLPATGGGLAALGLGAVVLGARFRRR